MILRIAQPVVVELLFAATTLGAAVQVAAMSGAKRPSQGGVSPGGKRTLRFLARTLRIPVFGTLKPLMKSHYDKLGFNPAFAHILAEASELA